MNWTAHSKTHWSGKLLGSRIDFWPTTRKWRWRDATRGGDIKKFIASHDPNSELLAMSTAPKFKHGTDAAVEDRVAGVPFEPGVYITVFCDASYCPNTKSFGYAYWIKHGAPPEVKRGRGRGVTTSSNEAEFEAIKAALRAVRDTIDFKDKHVVVQSDCTGALGKAAHLFKLFVHEGARSAYPKHVKGHSGKGDPRSAVNSYCDKHARREMEEQRKERS